MFECASWWRGVVWHCYGFMKCEDETASAAEKGAPYSAPEHTIGSRSQSAKHRHKTGKPASGGVIPAQHNEKSCSTFPRSTQKRQRLDLTTGVCHVVAYLVSRFSKAQHAGTEEPSTEVVTETDEPEESSTRGRRQFRRTVRPKVRRTQTQKGQELREARSDEPS